MSPQVDPLGTISSVFAPLPARHGGGFVFNLFAHFLSLIGSLSADSLETFSVGADSIILFTHRIEAIDVKNLCCAYWLAVSMYELPDWLQASI